MSVPIKIKVNGIPYNITVDDDQTLLSFLRDNMGLTGTKEGCGNGECGACTVMVDGVPMRSCLILAAEMDGKEIITIEGLSETKPGEDNKEHITPIQRAFIEEGAVQCGFCTPGFIMATSALLERKSNPDDNDIKEALSGHLCRCTGYKSIYRAVKRASTEST